ncbi:hypothetical protein SDC9_130677 [bioreactor metagenome]|uniref:Uncharacterized protein n=1 Tax=bioreactor metagenome TaxID=1076179 RepID=A0A645D3G9_9ZZZZ
MGDGAVLDLCDQRSAVAKIVHVLCPARGLLVCVHAYDAFADAFAHGLASFLTELPRVLDLTRKKRIYYEK